MPAEEPLRFRVGYRLAQLGGALHILGGLGDQAVRTLLPPHVELVGEAAAAAPGVSRLVLGLLHGLGSSLIAAGVAILVLLHLWRRDRARWLAVAIVAIAALAEGVNGVQILLLGMWIGWGPLVFAGLVASGVALAATAHPSPTRGTNSV